MGVVCLAAWNKSERGVKWIHTPHVQARQESSWTGGLGGCDRVSEVGLGLWKKEGRKEEKKERREAGREGKNKEGFICDTHISLNSAAALSCHLPGKLSRGMWLLSAGGTMCVRVPGIQQAVNKVRVTPTRALAVKGVVAQGTNQTIFPPGLHHATGSQDPWLQVSPREATEYQGLLWPLHPTQCVPMENVPAWKTQSTWCGHKHTFSFLWSPYFLLSLHLQPLGPFYVLPTVPGLQYGWQVLPSHIWFHGWLMGKER